MTPAPTGLKASLIGKWNIITVTTIGLDSTGNAIPSEKNIYPSAAGNYYQFNTDGTWAEVLQPDSAGIIHGSYAINSDTSFTLTNANPAAYVEICVVDSLSASAMVFTHRGPVKADKSYLEYIFNLSK